MMKIKQVNQNMEANSMPFLVFRWHVTCCPYRGAFAVRDHLRSSLGIISGLVSSAVGDHLGCCTEGPKHTFQIPHPATIFHPIPPSRRSKHLHLDPAWLNLSRYISPSYFDRWTIYSLKNNDNVPSLRREAKKCLRHV